MIEKVWYTLAIGLNNNEEYLMELTGDDCFTDDIGNALLFDTPDSLPELQMNEHVVRVAEDDEGGLCVIGKGLTAEIIDFRKQ